MVTFKIATDRTKLYICPDEEYPFPGVKENRNLSNRDDYPYLPCCYKKPQTGSKNYKAYYGENLEKAIEEKNRRVILTNRILGIDVFGVLPEYLNRLLLSFDPDKYYYRQGVSRSPNSFIECVQYAIGGSVYAKDDIKSIQEGLKNIRLNLVQEKKYIGVCKQENYDITELAITQHLRQTQLYFDPKKYVRILEEYYNCNIYLFDEQGMVIPSIKKII